jgi:hypothetical protein
MRLLVILAGVPGMLVDFVKNELSKDSEVQIQTLLEHEIEVHTTGAADLVVLTGMSPGLQDAIQRLRRTYGAPKKVIVVGSGPLAGEVYVMGHRGSNVSLVELGELVRTLSRSTEPETAALIAKDHNSTLEAPRSRV